MFRHVWARPAQRCDARPPRTLRRGDDVCYVPLVLVVVGDLALWWGLSGRRRRGPTSTSLKVLVLVLSLMLRVF